MTLQDQFRAASFRGVTFLVEGGEKSFGPRVITHEFPQRSEPWHEFSGQIPQEFTLEAALLGETGADDADKLEAALLDQSSATLVHPLYGSLDVVVIPPVRRRFSTAEAGHHRFTITFQRTGEEASPQTTVNTADAVSATADKSLTSLLDEFSDQFNPAVRSGYVLEAAAAGVRDLTAQVNGAFRVAGLADNVADGIIGTGISSLLNIEAGAFPAARHLGARLLALFAYDTRRAPVPVSLPSAMLALGSASGLGAATTPAPITTPSRSVAAANEAALVTLMRGGAAVEAIRAASSAGWSNHQEAIAWRNAAAATLDDLSDRVESTTTWRGLVDLRTAMAVDVTTRAAPLPRLMKVVPSETTSATLLAYRLDGDARSTLFARADDLVTRNKIRHPGFVRGGEELEVLK